MNLDFDTPQSHLVRGLIGRANAELRRVPEFPMALSEELWLSAQWGTHPWRSKRLSFNGVSREQLRTCTFARLLPVLQTMLEVELKLSWLTIGFAWSSQNLPGPNQKTQLCASVNLSLVGIPLPEPVSIGAGFCLYFDQPELLAQVRNAPYRVREPEDVVIFERYPSPPYQPPGVGESDLRVLLRGTTHDFLEHAAPADAQFEICTRT